MRAIEKHYSDGGGNFAVMQLALTSAYSDKYGNGTIKKPGAEGMEID